ncbi:MAG: NosD domain-containing protein, partial [Halobacteriota archaeon]|nr:NosD domain-containing protein [Halobacteriota archaeon]
GSKGPDPWVVGNWEEHTHANCTADFMGTNQWMRSDYSYNIDGGTIFAFDTSGAPTYDYQDYEPSLRLGCHGIRLFVESRGYNVNHDGNNYQNYNQYIEEIKPGGFSFQDFQSEIDAGRPVLIHVEGHTMIGYGYNDSSDLIYLHNTWDHNSHSMVWGDNYGGMIHYGVTVIKLEPVPTPVHNLKTSENFSTIQAAIDDADTSNGDVIEVDSGTYSENIVVSKSLTLRSSSGDPTDTIIITSDPGEHLINITSGYVNISGFTLKGATDSAKSGIYVEYAGLCRIENNNITDNYYGIYLNDSNYNSLKYNSVAGNNDSGFYLTGGSTGNDIFFNNIYGNTGFSFVNDQSIDALATDNWWGTTVNNTINTSIYDHYDDTSLGKVVYDPKLTSPSSGAPVPELSTVISLLIGLLALLGYVIRLEKNRGYRGTSV